ncbi:undecaprenyl-diphosphate phosphatase [Actinoplanes sp. CA-030573]|uniref:undecaprenyl-diphosphate phosphatase n=1 Tax=Actinoplanes sp. CA-030573 TaxID=3239898 RepID=UPI003D8F5BEC
MSDPTLTYPEAIVIGLLQGVTELFPVSSLGHSVLLPALIGGRWARDLSLTADKSPYLAFVVAVHVATAVALIWHFRADWVRIVRGLVSSVRTRSIATADQRLAWLLVAATIPVGLAGLALEHAIRTALGRPVPAAIFLIINGVMLAAVERVRARRAVRPSGAGAAAVPLGSAHQYAPSAHRDGFGSSAHQYAPSAHRDGVGSSAHLYASSAADPDQRLARQSWAQALLIGAAQILALFPGISRSGATIGAGLVRGLNHEDAARFAFLLATPVILAAGVLKMPELAAPSARGVLGPVLAGSLVAGVAAYVSVRFLTRYFETRTLNPFAVYCVVAGLFSLAWLSLA